MKALGARGVLRLAGGAVQVVVGPVADQLASEIRGALRAGAPAAALQSAPVVQMTQAPQLPPDPLLLARVKTALGGQRNIATLELRATRLCISVHDAGAVDVPALAKSVRAVAQPAARSIHLVVGPAADSWFAELKHS